MTERLDTGQYVISHVLPLNCGENAFLPQYDKILFHKEKIYIMDRDVNKAIFVFDSLGNYLSKIGEVGHALNELYRQPTDFSVHPVTGHVYLFEDEGRKIIKYDENGRYYSTDVLKDIWPYAFALTNSGDYAFAFRMLNDEMSQTYELSVYDSLEHNKSNFRVLFNHQMFTENMPFWSSDSLLYYTPNLSDTVFVLNADTISRAIHVDFQGRFLPDKVVSQLKHDGKLSILKDYEGYIQGIKKYEENDYWISVDYSVGIGMHYLKNKKTNKDFVFTSLFKGFFPSDLFFIKDKYLVYLITEDNMMDVISLKNENWWHKAYSDTHDVVKKMIKGEIELPALVYVEIK